MHPLSLPQSLQTFKKNNEINVKYQKLSFSCISNDITYKSSTEDDKSYYRITLQHKETGELKHFKSKWFTFKPELQLKPKLNEISNADINTSFISENDVNSPNSPQKETVTFETKKDMNLDVSFTEIKNCFSEAMAENNQIPLSIIAPSDVLQSLAVFAKIISTKNSAGLDEMVSSHTLYSSVLLLLKRQPTNDQKKIQLCLLLDHMIRFYLLKVKDLRKQNVNGCPGAVVKFLVNNFTVSDESKKGEIQMPKPLREKLLDSILCLCCFLSEYSFPLMPLQADLRSSMERLRAHLHRYGVEVTRPTKTVGDDGPSKGFIASTKTHFIMD